MSTPRGDGARDGRGRPGRNGNRPRRGSDASAAVGWDTGGAGTGGWPSIPAPPEPDGLLVTEFAATSDEPSRFDISGYRQGLYGGPAAELLGTDRPHVPPPEADGGARHQLISESSRGGSHQVAGDAEDAGYDDRVAGSLVRPYARTGGRTRSDYELAIEALVSTSERGRRRDVAVRPEYRSICGLCVDARSVAEVAAHLRLPLGVVRVLIGDMAGMGLVMIHESGMVMGDRPSMEFLERVLSGLRRL